MSFWSTLGDVAKSLSPLAGALDAARVAAQTEDPNAGPDGISDNAKQFASAFATNLSGPLQVAGAISSTPVGRALNWAPNQADHLMTSVWNVGDIAEAHGGSQWTPLTSMQSWKDAWNQTAGGPNIGQTIAASAARGDLISAPANKPLGGTFGASPEAQALRNQDQQFLQSTTGRIAGGALDIAMTWYADPTLGLGKAAKIARAGSRIVDGAHAEDVFQAGEKMAQAGVTPGTKLGRGLGGVASTSVDETYSRAYNQVAKTDNMDQAATAAHYAANLARTPDAGPIIGVLGQASKIEDLHLQRQVKMDTVLAAAGSDSARARLITSAPHIARALQRRSLPPEAYQIIDDIFAARNAGMQWGDSLAEAAGKYNTTENKAELDAYANALDDIHARLAAVDKSAQLGGIENVGGSVLNSMKSTYRAGMAKSFFFQDGPSGRGVQFFHWATGQRMRGSIATDDAVRGHDELVDVMKRAKTIDKDGNQVQLFSGSDIRATADQWWQAPNQEARSALAQQLPERILGRLANTSGLGRDDLNEILSSVQNVRAAAKTYATRAMASAQAEGKSRIVLDDPMTGTPISIDKALFETHVENHVGVPDVADLSRLVRHYQNAGTYGDTARKSMEWTVNHAEALNDVWRTLTLARVGLIVRTQLDTQARSAMVFGATKVAYDAMKGLGYKITDKLAGPQIQQISDAATQIARHDDLMDQAGELRRQASFQSGGKGDALLSRADSLETEAKNPTPLVATGRRAATKPTDVSLGGQTVTTRAANSDAELQGITSALHTGPQTLSEGLTQTLARPDAPRSVADIIGRLAGKKQLRFVEKSGDWETTMPNELKWQTAWVRSTHALVNSDAGKAILNTMDRPSVDMVQALRSSPEVRNAWRAVRGQNPQFESWLDHAITQAQWTAPTKEIRDALRSGKVITPDIAEKMFKPRDIAEGDTSFDHLPDRMPVHAPAMDMIRPDKSSIQSVMDLPRFAVRWMSDQPDTVLGRVPFYRNAFFQNFKELGQREVDRVGVLTPQRQADIEAMSRHRAIMDTRKAMYDTARFTGAHDRAGRTVFAFIGAWEDAMRAWSRMFYDDPSRIGKLTKMWYAPDRAGLVVDDNGNPVRPGEEAPQGQSKWLTVPVSWVPGVNFKDFKLRKDSFNTVFNGNVPWVPGMGPMVQVAVNELAARTFPELASPDYKIAGHAVGDNPLWQQFFGSGLPKIGVSPTDQAMSVAQQLTPSWMKRAADWATGNTDKFSDAYGMALNTELMKARTAGKNINDKNVLDAADRTARSTARSMMFMDLVSNFGLGLSGEGSTTADFYRSAYRDILNNADALSKQSPPRTPQEEMLRLYPEAAGLKWSFSTNDTGINASISVENRVRKYGTDIQKNPEFGWFYVGSDNVGGQFSQASYAAQFGREASPGSGTAWRSKMNASQIKDATAGELGWNDYYKVKDQIDTILQQRGLHSISQKGAEDLKQVFGNFKTQLGNENPTWLQDYSSIDRSKMERFISQVALPATKDPRMKDRSDVKAMAQYLSLRQQAMDYANSQGYSLSSQSAAPIRAILDQAGQGMAQENIGFGQMWTRMFEREVG